MPAREAEPTEAPIARRLRRHGPERPLPTVGDVLDSGPQGVIVNCCATRPGGWRCHHRGRVALAQIKVPRDTPYTHIPRARVLRCSRCGSRDVGVMPEWPSPQEAQARRMSDGATPVRTLNGIVVPFGGKP